MPPPSVPRESMTDALRGSAPSSERMRAALFIAHGYDDNTGGAAETQARHMEDMLGARVAYVFKDDSREEALEKFPHLSRGDVEEVVVIPLFFTSNTFTDRMVHRKVGLGSGDKGVSMDVDGKRVRVRIARSFETDPIWGGVIGSALSRYGAESERTAVVMVGHGSKDGSNAMAVEFNAGIAMEFGYDTFTCYDEFCRPTVEETMDGAIGEGFDDILVIPMFVSPNNHFTVEVPAKLGLENCSRERIVERIVERDGRRMRVRYAIEICLEAGVVDILCKMANS